MNNRRLSDLNSSKPIVAKKMWKRLKWKFEINPFLTKESWIGTFMEEIFNFHLIANARYLPCFNFILQFVRQNVA